MIFEENLQYRHATREGDELPEEWKVLLRWIGNGKIVLEAGCHTGDFSKRLKDAGCSITGIDINETALLEAQPFLHEAICGDLESIQTWNQLNGKKFNVILFEHVLEHLSNPWKILNIARNFIESDGTIIIALPNISNAKNRFDMFFGHFNYEDLGVMDRTHLRFFNQTTAREMITQAGLKLDDYASPWRVNPVRELIDHLPLITYLRVLLPLTPDRRSLFSRNLTDVIMLLKCSIK